MGKSAVVARLSTLASNLLDLFVGTVVEITGVRVVDHCEYVQYVQGSIMIVDSLECGNLRFYPYLAVYLYATPYM